MAEERILDKILKILALTQSNYQEEAQVALLKAQKQYKDKLLQLQAGMRKKSNSYS